MSNYSIDQYKFSRYTIATMANTKSAIKRVRRITRQTLVNRSRKSKFRNAIKKIQKGEQPSEVLPENLHIFGISSLAPTQIELIQALSYLIDVKL